MRDPLFEAVGVGEQVLFLFKMPVINSNNCNDFSFREVKQTEGGQMVTVVKVAEHKTASSYSAAELSIVWKPLETVIQRYVVDIRPRVLKGKPDGGYLFPSSSTGGKMSKHGDAMQYIRDVLLENGFSDADVSVEQLEQLMFGPFRKA